MKILAIFVLKSLLLSSCVSEKLETTVIDIPNAKQGFELYGKYCHQCHGLAATGSPLARFNVSQKEITKDENQFLALVMEGRDGTYMKGFAKKLNQKHVESIRLYLLELNTKK